MRAFFEATLVSGNLALQIAARDSAKVRSIVVEKVKTDGEIIIRKGERPAALKFLNDWMIKHLGSSLKICDPYFGPEELELLKSIQQINPECHVQILTAEPNKSGGKTDETLQEKYDNYWRHHLSDQLPPDTDIVIVSINKKGGSPIHDRWWITESAGLRLGTSFNSIGDARTSEISIIPSELLAEREAEIDQYLQRRRRDANGNELTYKLFRLMQ